MEERTRKINVLGVGISAMSKDELNTYIVSTIRSDQRNLILNANAHCLNLAFSQLWLREFLNSAPIVFEDGYGVILAARILGFSIPERITYADWMWDLAELCADNNLSLFFLGARPGIAESASRRLKARSPTLEIAGIHHGYFTKKLNHDENIEVIQTINKARPNILIVGFGMPLQERWLLDNWEQLDVNIALTGGAVFDYVSGELRRSPRWLRTHGLEWLGRLLIEPRRLWMRYVLGNPLFLFRVISQRLGLLSVE